MNDLSTPDAMKAWVDLASRWQETATQWSRWWSQIEATPAGAPMPSRSDARAMAATAEVPAATPAETIAALAARYRPRFEALWLAAQRVALEPGAPDAVPSLAAPRPGDRRFAAPEWDTLPYFALLKQHYLLTAQYLTELADLAPLTGPDKHRLAFMTRQLVDAMAPSNFAATNPEVWKRALATQGASLVNGFENFIADARRGRIAMTDEAAFGLGRNLAVTPGDVVFRNELIELIQYRPSTPRVRARPLLIVPPCINKFYILDLQPDNSFVRWSVAQGHTVFMVSWRNIPPALGHLAWDDYVGEGVLAAMQAARAITRSATLNVVGFCIGGAILACALAVLAARDEKTVASVTLLTTMLDYADPGEIGVYLSREFLATREPALLAGRPVPGGEIATAFASLRANELVWNYVVNNYLKGQTPPAFDLLYWNGDSSNLPGPMYAYYLRDFYLDNRLREPGALTMLGESIDLRRIAAPAYVYGSREDHIVPWRSAYRSLALLGGPTTFVLGASGHIAGVVNPPERKKRNYWTNEHTGTDADDWLAHAQSRPGSWWAHWGAWIARHAGRQRAAPHHAGDARHPVLGPAPGEYVKTAAG